MKIFEGVCKSHLTTNYFWRQLVLNEHLFKASLETQPSHLTTNDFEDNIVLNKDLWGRSKIPFNHQLRLKKICFEWTSFKASLETHPVFLTTDDFEDNMFGMKIFQGNLKNLATP